MELVPSNNEDMLSASAKVMHLGRIDRVKVGFNPTNRPKMAVEYREKIVEMTMDENISAAFLLTSYIQGQVGQSVTH